MKKMNILMAGLLILAIASTSCKKVKEDPVISGTETFKGPKTSATTNVVTRARNLAVVYFIPSDLDTVAGWQTRLPELMTYVQGWYGDQMQAAGYGNKPFGLDSDAVTGKARIVLIRGANPKASYGTSAVSYANEINAYFASHPGLKTSNHVLILIPAFGYDNNTTEGPQPLEGVQPFYGYGRYCFAMDNVYMNLALKGVINPGRNNFAKWAGGMMHELGHAFNALHDKQRVSQNQWPGSSFNEALMCLSNYYMGVRPCFITDGEAAIFDKCEVFNAGTATYYGAVNTSVSKIYGSYDSMTSSIQVSGKFTTNGTVSKIAYYLDPNVNNEGIGVNKDYNAITWASTPIGVDSFKVSIPIAELQYKSDGIPYEFKLRFVHDNGTIVEKTYFFTFQGGIPVINFGYKPELAKTGWSIASYSSQETSSENGAAANVLDGSATTHWHSKYSGSPTGSYPHQLTINLGSAKTATGLSWLNRVGSSRAIKNFEVLTSTDGVNFTSRGNFVAQQVDGKQYYGFGSSLTFQYFKIIGNSSWDGTQFAAIAELGLY